MITAFEYRWDEAYSAFLASGLTITQFHSSRAAEFSLNGWTPRLSTYLRNFRRIKAKCEPEQSNFQIATIENLSKAPVANQSSKLPFDIPHSGLRSVALTLPSGAKIEFTSSTPELFALAALRRSDV